MGSDRTMPEAERQVALYNDLSPKEAGRLMGGISAAQVRGLIEAGELRAMNVSRAGASRRTYRIRQEWVEAWIDRRTVNADAA